MNQVKNIGWVFLLAFAFPFSVAAQIASESQKFSLGIKAGALTSWPGFGDKEDKDRFSRKLSVGYTGGFLVDFPMKGNYRFLSEFVFTQKGRKLTFNDDEWENRSVYKFLEATMLLRKSYKFALQENVPAQWFFNIGPEIGYWLNGKGKLIVNEPGFPYAIIFDQAPDGNFNNMYYNHTNRWLFALALGVGMKAPLLRNQNVTLEMRFVSGHTFLGRSDSSHMQILGFTDTLKTNMKSVNFSVAYAFDFDMIEGRKGKSTINKKVKKGR